MWKFTELHSSFSVEMKNITQLRPTLVAAEYLNNSYSKSLCSWNIKTHNQTWRQTDFVNADQVLQYSCNYAWLQLIHIIYTTIRPEQSEIEQRDYINFAE